MLAHAMLVLVSAAAASGCSTLVDGQAIVFADMHDGDEKIVSIVDGAKNLQIEPWNSKDVWKVTAPLTADCTAMVDFNVPGKRSPPPVAVMATLSQFQPTATKRAMITFTDPSGTLAPGKPYYPLNAWLATQNKTFVRETKA
jgi:hypothetical protein